MPFATLMTHILECNDIEFFSLPYHPVGTEGHIQVQRACAVFLRDPQGLVIAIIPENARLDFRRLKSLLQRPVLRYPTIESSGDMRWLNRSDSVKLNQSLELIIDESINHHEQLVICSPEQESALLVNTWDLVMQIDGAVVGGQFSISPDMPVSRAVDISA